MPIFKAPNNDTFRRDSEDQTGGLPDGCVIITEQDCGTLAQSACVKK